MLGHELQEQQGLVDVAPALPRVLQPPRNHTHDLLVALHIIRRLGNLCTRTS